MVRKSKNLTQQKKNIIYVCGVTEQSYLRKLLNYYNVTNLFDIKVITDQGLLGNVKKYKNDKYNKYFLVIDQDDKTISELQKLKHECSKLGDFKLILNSECFEAWLLAHFQQVDTHFSRNILFAKLESFFNVDNYSTTFKTDWGKLNNTLGSIINELVVNNYHAACDNIEHKDLNDMLNSRNSITTSQSYSNMNILVDFIIQSANS